MVVFNLVLQTRVSLRTDGEPDQWVTEYDGVVVCEDERGRERRAGRVRARRVNAIAAATHGTSLFEVCDCHSQELHELHTLLYQPGGYDFRGAVERQYEAYDADLLVLDYVVLHPRWRGLRLGLLTARRVVDMLGVGCGLAVADIAPLRPEAHEAIGVPASWLPANEGAEARRAAIANLRRYFRRMGFKRLGRTPYYALPMAKKTPTAEELLGRPENRADR